MVENPPFQHKVHISDVSTSLDMMWARRHVEEYLILMDGLLCQKYSIDVNMHGRACDEQLKRYYKLFAKNPRLQEFAAEIEKEVGHEFVIRKLAPPRIIE